MAFKIKAEQKYGYLYESVSITYEYKPSKLVRGNKQFLAV
jgi:hypothetical protein